VAENIEHHCHPPQQVWPLLTESLISSAFSETCGFTKEPKHGI